MMILSFSFIILYASKYFANDQGIVSAYWLVASYFFQSLGELLISAIGLSMFAQLAPAKLNGFMIGVWWVFLAFASILGGQVAKLVEPAGSEDASTSITLINYTSVFLYIGLSVFVFSILMFALSPIKRKLLKAK
jgi:POT family proton-dependent oligopeptide transporter